MFAKNESDHEHRLPLALHQAVARGDAASDVDASRPGGAVRDDPWSGLFIKLLNDALASELVCLLRYMRLYFRSADPTACGPGNAYQVQVDRVSAHAERLAQHIGLLGGEPEFWPDALSLSSHAMADESLQLSTLIRAHLVAERLAIARFGQMALRIGDSDAGARQLAEGILGELHAHSEQLRQWLAR